LNVFTPGGTGQGSSTHRADDRALGSSHDAVRRPDANTAARQPSALKNLHGLAVVHCHDSTVVRCARTNARVIPRPNVWWLDRCRGLVISKPVAWACGSPSQCCLGDRVRCLDHGSVEPYEPVPPSNVQSRTRDLPRPCGRRVLHGLSAPVPGARWRPLDRCSILDVQRGMVCDVRFRRLGLTPTSPPRGADRAVLRVGWGRRQWHGSFVARSGAGRLFSRGLDSAAMFDCRHIAVASTFQR